MTLTSQLQQQDPSSQLVSIGEHHQDVVLEDVGFVRGHQSIVERLVLDLKCVVTFYLKMECNKTKI